ncbi:hypothetical protein SPRG_16829 [Saprolegnia parasitica CBS 223.65]|uniref:Uncharacterized protein n=1 Tax=Saprolegnia parasitica (strain CBS 223.65) TaxID=695850 RepID=A0A067BHZ6_SAPPC|nr:hypothetical protein SPRG_16829 [Saprolegnia parasitica CBS 223.65]KDO17768.1 hypothetical protein SPRG_16829 [Saprolegnia parasitica CBS 223.65]|eukprot:XP_012211527.1 hypothetical protein SPRG_16829 [Saprolegnia parasitica CBS 223.65]
MLNQPPGNDGTSDPAKKPVLPRGARKNCWMCKATDHELSTCLAVTDPGEREAVQWRVHLAKTKTKAPATVSQATPHASLNCTRSTSSFKSLSIPLFVNLSGPLLNTNGQHIVPSIVLLLSSA